MARLLPAWAKASLIAFCVVELALLVTLRTVSGVAHLRTVQNVSDMSAATVAATCSETVAAIDDFWPAVGLLSVGRVLPLPIAQAWGQVPVLVGIAHDTCPAVAAYTSIVPAPERTLQDGAAADAVTNIRRQQSELSAADSQLQSGWSKLQMFETGALGGDARLARAARALGVARDQQADVEDALAFLAPERLETFLGGDAPRAIVLSVVDDAPGTQAYAVLDQGRVTATDVGQPSAAPAAIVSVNRAGLQSLQGTLSHAQIAPGASDAEVARALLVEFTRLQFADEQNVVAVLKHAADDHNAWLWFDDPSLQDMVARRGWLRV
jgi:hypothetical protein